MNAPWARRLSALHRDQRGQAMVLGVIYFLLLAALVFLVINSGKKANSKITMQNTADATAATSATWIARGLNTISMCNVTQTQLMSVIVLLDSMETVAPVGQRIIDDLLSNIGASTHGSEILDRPGWLAPVALAHDTDCDRRAVLTRSGQGPGAEHLRVVRMRYDRQDTLPAEVKLHGATSV